VTAQLRENNATEVMWERPILHAKISLYVGRVLHIINLHLKSKLASFVQGQQLDQFTWKTASGWAEGFFLS
jgi:hypothetical protein